MTLEPGFLEMMPHTVTIEPFASRDGYGVSSYGTSRTHRARIEGGNRQVITPEGEEKVSTRLVFIDPVPVGQSSPSEMTTKDRITLPAGYSPAQPVVLRVDREDDETGIHHLVCFT